MSQKYRDIAYTTQKKFEHELLRFMKNWKYMTGEEHLMYSGGCALNCKANRLLLDEFKSVYTPFSAGDRGLSIGCGYLGAVKLGDTPKPLLNAYLGESYTNSDIKKELDSNRIGYSEVDSVQHAAKAVEQGKIIGWVQGRSEAGARALGNRSILSRADLPDMRDKVNSKIKFREEFRPFAPAVLEEDCLAYFSGGTQNMTMAFEAKSNLPAVVHVDATSRVQTVSSSDNEKFRELIYGVKKLTGKGVVLNTSFNLKGQPIVETPRDALMTFFGCGLDSLYLGDFVIEK
jgi:carbamoyltransferase